MVHSGSMLWLCFVTTVAASTSMRAPPVIVINGVDLLEAVEPARYEYGYECEAGGVCNLPTASASDYFDEHVTVNTAYYKLEGHTTRKVNTVETELPATFNIYFDAMDKSGNRAKQVTITLFVKDTTQPVISMCGESTYTLEYQPSKRDTTACAPTAMDNIDGNLTTHVHTRLFYKGQQYPLDVVKQLTAHVGKWEFKYDVRDAAGNQARTAIKTVFIDDTIAPVISMNGASPKYLECGVQYVDEGAVATDPAFGNIPVSTFGGSQRSCMDIITFNPRALSGNFFIQHPTVNNGQPLEVWCDFDTDGGGYTYYPISDGVSSNRYDADNSCKQLGLQLAVWRTEDHMNRMLAMYGASHFKAVPGIYGTAGAVNNRNFVNHAMNSGDNYTAHYWKAVDNGAWFLRADPAAEPSGNYEAGCYLGIFGFNHLRLNDDLCAYSTGSKYVCSTNDKKGNGIFAGAAMAAGGGLGNYPPQVPGDYIIMYRACDPMGLDAPPKTRAVFVRDTIAPEITTDVAEEYVSITQVAKFARSDSFAATYETQSDCSYGQAEACKFVWTKPKEERGGGDWVQFYDPGISCGDSCSDASVTFEWDKPFDPSSPNYYRKDYKCTDTSNNTAAYSRTWIYIESTLPQIVLNREVGYLSMVVKFTSGYDSTLASVISVLKRIDDDRWTSWEIQGFTAHIKTLMEEPDAFTTTISNYTKSPQPAAGGGYTAQAEFHFTGYSNETFDASGRNILLNAIKAKVGCTGSCDATVGDVKFTFETQPGGSHTPTETYYVEAAHGKPFVEPGARCTDATSFFRLLSWQDQGVWKPGLYDANVRIAYPGGVKPNPGTLGEYEVIYSCTDNDGAIAGSITRTVVVQDTTCVDTTLRGKQWEAIEAGFSYQAPNPGVYAWDSFDGNLTDGVWSTGDTVDVSSAYYTHYSCLDIMQTCQNQTHKGGSQRCPSGVYTITVFPPQGSAQRLEVYCDMHTDGGGYTYFNVSEGIRTYARQDPDSCKALGLQMVVPRTKAHFQAMVDMYGMEYFNLVPGVYGTERTSNRFLKQYGMNSEVPEVAVEWKAIDGGDWYLRDTPLTTSIYDGAYFPGCWLGMSYWHTDGAVFDARLCAYSDRNYVCSTNDKGGPGVMANVESNISSVTQHR
jgi:hypothetical protein